jgi:hypothetical protein
MRVRIGKYPSWFGPYQLAEKLMFWVPKERDKHGFEHTADRVHRFGEWLAYGSIEPEPQVGEVRPFMKERPMTWLYRFLTWIHSFRRQRIDVQIDPWDTWGMDHTLAHIVLPMLRQLKEKTHGAPYVDLEDVPRELHGKKLTKKQRDNGEVDDKHFERWYWILDEMIFAFESKLDDSWEEQFESGESDHQLLQLEGGMSQMIDGPRHTKVYDWEGRKVYESRIQNGFRLFGKYYQNLWD